MRGESQEAHHNVQVKLADECDTMDWHVAESIADLPAWRAVYVDLRALERAKDADPSKCAGNPSLDLSKIVRIEIGIGRCLRAVAEGVVECETPHDTNVLLVDEIAAVDLRPGATHRMASTPPEPVTADVAVAASVAAAMRDLQELNGLAPAWYEEAQANYNTYAQAVRILVLVREYQRTGDGTYQQAAESAVAAMLARQEALGRPHAGAWFTAYEWNGSSFVPRDGCTGNESVIHDVDRCFWVGNTAWMIIALDRARSGLPGDHAATTAAIDLAADWMTGNVGRLSDVPDVITYGLEGNISAYFGLLAAGRLAEAASLGAAIVTHGWDASEARMKIGVLPHQLGTAMDTAGSWGAQLLRCLDRGDDASSSQAYIASMYRTSSFDGAREGYGDVEGPWTMTVEFGAQGAAAGIPGAQRVMDAILALQAPNGSFPGGADDFLGGSAWITTWHGLAPGAWVYFAMVEDPLPLLCASRQVLIDGTTLLSELDGGLYRTGIGTLTLSGHGPCGPGDLQIVVTNERGGEVVGTCPEWSVDVPLWPGINRLHITARRGGVDLTTVIVRVAFFTDSPLVGRETPIKAIHFLDLREAINWSRDQHDLPPFDWADEPPARCLLTRCGPVRASHLNDLRKALDQLWTKVKPGTPAPFTTTTVNKGAVIRASHLAELRAALEQLD